MTSQCDPVIGSIRDHLASGDIANARSLVCDDQHRALIYECAWDLVLPSLLALEEDVGREDRVCTEDIRYVFKEIINRGKPKEVLLSLVMHLSQVKSISVFVITLQGLQSILLSLPHKQLTFLKWTLPHIERHLASLPDPEKQPPEEETEMNADIATQTITDHVSAVLSFLDPFIQESSFARASERNAQPDLLEKRKVLLNHLFAILGRCGVLDLCGPPEKPESNSCTCVKQLVSAMAFLSSDLAALTFSDTHKDAKTDHATCDTDLDDNCDDKQASDISDICPATLAYLLYAKLLVPDIVPYVYSQRYIFEKNLRNVMFLLSHPAYHVVDKGVSLCNALVARQLCDQYSSLDLDNSAFTALFHCLLRVMVTCPLKDTRQKAVEVFCSYLKIFNGRARSSIYCRLLKGEEHAGIRGFLVDRFRSDLHHWRPSSEDSENPFCGRSIVGILRTVCVLPDREETHLLDHSDCILAVLNLLRYVSLTSLKQGSDDVVNSVLQIAGVYGEQLKKDLDLSRAHYVSSLKQLEDNTAKLRNIYGNSATTTDHDVFPTLPREQEMEVVKVALARLDLMESVLVLAQESLKLVSSSLKSS